MINYTMYIYIYIVGTYLLRQICRLLNIINIILRKTIFKIIVIVIKKKKCFYEIDLNGYY